MSTHKNACFQIMIKRLKKNSILLGIFLANIIFIILRKTNSLLVHENNLLPYHITSFEEDTYIRSVTHGFDRNSSYISDDRTYLRCHIG